MNQEKIGKYICEKRKQLGMTQKKLAEQIGITDKAISKWETGKSLPDTATIDLLCKALNITVNDLLSGEDISINDYSKKAEQNMKDLMENCDKQQKKNEAGHLAFASFMVIIIVAMSQIIYWQGFSHMYAWLDTLSVLVIGVVALFCLIVTKTQGDFANAFKLVKGYSEFDSIEIKKSMLAVQLVQNAVLFTGILISVIGFVSTYIEMNVRESQIFITENQNIIASNLAVAALGILYGVIGYLLLLPLRMKLKIMRLEI